MIAFMMLAALLGQQPVYYKYPKPLIVEVLRDVEVGGSSTRGNLHFYPPRFGDQNYRPPTPFVIKKGQTFETLGEFGEGACQIRFQGRIIDIAECRWVDGFADQQPDVFKVIPNQPERVK